MDGFEDLWFYLLEIDTFAGGLENPAQSRLFVHHHENGAMDEKVVDALALGGLFFDRGQLERIHGQLRDFRFCSSQEQPAIWRRIDFKSFEVIAKSSWGIEVRISCEGHESGLAAARQRT